MNSPRDSRMSESEAASCNDCDQIVRAEVESVGQPEDSDARFDQTDVQVICESPCEPDGSDASIVGALTRDPNVDAFADEGVAGKTSTDSNLRSLQTVPTPSRERNPSRPERRNCCKSAKATVLAMPRVISAATSTIRTAVCAGADYLLDCSDAFRRQALGQESLAAQLIHSAS